jgi:uncharacterized caspase-like protein
MEEVKNFANTIKPRDLVLFFFSGHGCRVNNQNYLIPIEDSRIETDEDVEQLGTSVKRILDRLIEKKLYAVISILDCCRPYWLKSSSTPNCK